MANFIFPDKTILAPNEKDFLEAARYIGYSRLNLPDDQIFSMIKTACAKLFEVLKPQAVFEEFDLQICEEKLFAKTNEAEETGGTDIISSKNKISDAATLYKINFADVQILSKDLGRNLKDCKKVFLMAATIGPQVDAIIRREQNMDAAMAAVLQGAGAMFIEKLVDFVNEQIKSIANKDGMSAKPRYSPGYGDVPLLIQKDFFRLLPCTRIGLTLMDTLIMAPEKSVTAFVGAF